MDVRVHKWLVIVQQCVGKRCTSLSVDSRTPRKKGTRSSRICMTHSEEPRAAESGLRLPNEIDYLFLFIDLFTLRPAY